jgi:uncharacterized coiled-coil protein SlyX
MTRRARKVHAALNRWRLRPGQLVIVDEASMAGTLELDALTTQARQCGAKILLVGDPAQLSPVAAGGAFRLLVTDRRDAPQLTDVRRFRHEWERSASLAMRDGRPSAADPYFAHGRVRAGDRDTVLADLYQAWRADVRAGRSSLMVAADATTALELNHRARTDLVATGEVGATAVLLADGSAVGVGDLVVTRLNQRDLRTQGGWVKNGDRWRVTAVNRDGSLTVHGAGRAGASARLPAEYVHEHVELGYATTAHRAQGRTVDTCHAYISAATVREPLYVMATRGREANRLYVDTGYDPDTDTAHQAVDPVPAEVVLRTVLATSGADLSATQTKTAESAAAVSPARLETDGAAINNHRRAQRYLNLLSAAGVTEQELEVARRGDHLRVLIERLHRAESLGLDADRAIAAVAQRAHPHQPLLVPLQVGLGNWLNHPEPGCPPPAPVSADPPCRSTTR